MTTKVKTTGLTTQTETLSPSGGHQPPILEPVRRISIQLQPVVDKDQTLRESEPHCSCLSNNPLTQPNSSSKANCPLYDRYQVGHSLALPINTKLSTHLCCYKNQHPPTNPSESLLHSSFPKCGISHSVDQSFYGNCG